MNFARYMTDKCKGVIFRADVQNFQTQKGMGFSVRLNKMKRLSCKGCMECGGLESYFGEISNEWPIVGIEKVEHGKLYSLQVVNIEKDFESGIVDGWDLGLVEYKEEKEDEKGKSLEV